MTSKKYKSVVEMVRAISDDQEFVDGFERHSADRRLAGSLFAVRAAKGLSQKDIAERLGCTQSRISKLENSDDSSFRLGDLAAYVKALGLHFRLVLSKRDETIVEQVKYHAICIKKLLDQLARLAQDDKRIAGGVSAFFGESFFNMIRMLQDSASKLPPRGDGMPYIQIELHELLHAKESDSFGVIETDAVSAAKPEHAEVSDD